MNSKRSGAVRLPLKEPVILKSEHDPFLYGNIAKRDVIETISRKAISSLSKEISENYKPGSLLSLPGITFKLQALNLPAPLFPGRSYHYGVPNAIPLSYKTREVSASSPPVTDYRTDTRFYTKTGRLFTHVSIFLKFQCIFL